MDVDQTVATGKRWPSTSDKIFMTIQLQDHFSNFRCWIFRSSDMQVVLPSWTQLTFVIAALDNS